MLDGMHQICCARHSLPACSWAVDQVTCMVDSVTTVMLWSHYLHFVKSMPLQV
jgi:hypothetical protein